MDVIIEIVMPILAAIFGGGWFVNWKEKKRLEQSNADRSDIENARAAADLAEDISKKYITLINGAISDIPKRLERIEKDVNLIGLYLNGNFAKWKDERNQQDNNSLHSN